MNIPKIIFSQKTKGFFFVSILLWINVEMARESSARTVLKITRGREQKKAIESHKNYLECRQRYVNLIFWAKSAVKFITVALFFSLYQQKNRIKLNNKCSPFYNGEFSDSKTCYFSKFEIENFFFRGVLSVG
jgi:hypothetical protein